MRSLPDDARLLILVTLNALVLTAAARFVRRRNPTADWLQVVIDTILIWYLVQYAAIALPGLIGMLNAGTMMLTASALSIAMIVAPKSGTTSHGAPEPVTKLDQRLVLVCLAVLCSLMAGQIYNVRYAPPNANDALTYHLPAAVTWLQTGRIGLFETWFFNPANTYSPLAGSMFMAWLMVPMSTDILARGVQVPALVVIFFVLLQLARTLGANIRLAAFIALAGCCARPMVHQVFLAKDDLFVTAFFGVAILSMTRARIREPLGHVRLGIVLGLLFATKYTALMCLPILVLMIDRHDWRRYATAMGVALVLAGPWYLRNLILTGNPLFPIDVPMFDGMFRTARSVSLRTSADIWRTLTSYSGLPAVAITCLVFLWIGALVRVGLRIRSEPLVRTVVLGPPIMIALFIATSPYAEVRFIYPALLLAFAAVALSMSWFRVDIPRIVAAVVLVGVMIGTSAIPRSLALMRDPALCSLLVCAIFVITIEMRSLAMWAFMLFGIAAVTYVYWQPYANQYRDDATRYWQLSYAPLADAWEFARGEIPIGATIAYSNTHFVHPLFGADFDRRVVYAPVRPDVRTIADLGRIDIALPGERIVEHVEKLISRDADRETWFANLRATGAQYLFIVKPRAGSEVPEIEFVRQSRAFQQVFDNPTATIYAVSWPTQ